MTVRWGTGQLEGLTLMRSHRYLRAISLFERVQFGFSYENRIGGSRSPFVIGETLVLSEILVAGFAHDEGTTARLLRDSIIVTRVFEGLAVLDPPVPVDKNNRLNMT